MRTLVAGYSFFISQYVAGLLVKPFAIDLRCLPLECRPSSPSCFAIQPVDESFDLMPLAAFCTSVFYESDILSTDDFAEISNFEYSSMQSRKQSFRTLMLTATSSSTLEHVGYIEMSEIRPSVSLIRNVCVKSNFRRLGVGRLLVLGICCELFYILLSISFEFYDNL